MASGTAVSRLLGFLRSTVWAWALGLNTVGAAYLVANTVPNIIFSLLAGGVLNAVLVPQIVRALGQATEEGAAYVNRLLTLAVLVLALLTAAATLAAPVISRAYAGSNWSEHDLSLATMFAYWCMPQIFFYGIYTMFGQVLNARGKFGAMMWSPVANNIVAIVTGVLFLIFGSVDVGTGSRASSSLSSLEVAALGGGTTLGVAVQAAILAFALKRNGFNFRPRFDLRDRRLARAGHLAKWTVLFVLVNQATYWVVVRVANTAGKAASETSDVAAGLPSYSNAYLIFLLPHSVLTVSLVAAMLPKISADAAANRIDRISGQLSHAIGSVGLLTVPAAAAFLALGPLLTRALYFGNPPADAMHVGHVLMAFAPGLVFFSAQHIVLRAFYALEDTRTPFLIQCCIAVVNMALVMLAEAVLPPVWVVVGMAAGYAVTYLVGVILSVAVLRRRLPDVDARGIVTGHLRTAAVVLAPASAAFLVGNAVAGSVPDSAVSAAAGTMIGGAVLGGGYLVLARAFGLQDLWRLVRRGRQGGSYPRSTGRDS